MEDCDRVLRSIYQNVDMQTLQVLVIERTWPLQQQAVRPTPISANLPQNITFKTNVDFNVLTQRKAIYGYAATTAYWNIRKEMLAIVSFTNIVQKRDNAKNSCDR